VAEFLDFYQLRHSLKIFLPEINLSSNHKTRSQLAESFNLRNPDPDTSLLQQLLFSKSISEPRKPEPTSQPTAPLFQTHKEDHSARASPEDKKASVKKLNLDIEFKSPGNRSDPMYLSPRSANPPVLKPLVMTPDEDSIEADMSRLRQINDEILQLTHPRGKIEEVDLDDEPALRSYEFNAPPRVGRSQDSDNVIFASKESFVDAEDLGGESVNSSALDGCDHFEEIEKSDIDN
jgi:hypothetical protein